MGPFSGQTILVTGASGGVGEAVARRLGEQGAKVCLTGRNRQRLEKIAGDLPAGTARCYPADLTVEDELQNAVQGLLKENQRLDAVIHCAAIIILGTVATAAVQDFEKQFHTNVTAPFRLTQLLLPALVSSRGQVVFINSSAGRHASAGVGQYAATKHALKAVADSLRDECNAAGVRVCSLFLGSTATPMQAGIRAEQERAYEPERLIQPADVAEMVAALLALPRTAEVTDLVMRPMEKA
ncbi:MAG: SDR family oxidoreductase [Verrucomicrobiota bacterium]|nr:SDR family oxidoreductase [Verrucomicrobiota bacterium]